MSRTNLDTFLAKGAFLNIEYGYCLLFVPGYRFIFTDVKTLAAVGTAGITLLSARNIP